jgi:uncharacterized zinc-type alcohol dehydrogenase-like protein
MSEVRALAALGPGRPLEPFAFDPGPLGPEEVEVQIEYCGVCHSDLSILQNDWGISAYPCVPGHEAIGRIVALGELAKGLAVGERVGIGWTAGSCMHCHWCLSGDQQLCPKSEATIVGHFGAFAERVRAHWAWAIPIPQGLDPSAAGPLLCGGITVFDPLLHRNIKPTDHVGIVGIGGLGHMAVKFASAWGCEVTAFTSRESKFAEAKSFGAHHAALSTDPDSIRKLTGTLDLLLVTVNVPLDWDSLLETLSPKGCMHLVGAVPEPIPLPPMTLISGQRSVSGSPTGSPTSIAMMLEFAARHSILPQVEHFPMSRANEALERLKQGKPRYRIVLDADWS